MSIEQEFQYNQEGQPQVLAEEYQAPQKSLLLFYIIGGVVFIAMLTAGAFFLFGDLFKPAEASIRLETDQGTFEGEATVSESRNNILKWNSVNAESCQLTSNIDERTIEVSTNEGVQGFRLNIPKILTSDADRTMPRISLPKELPVNLKPGEEAIYTLTCDEAADTITISVRHYLLTDFKKAENRWADRFDTSNIPTDSFKAFYFNSVEPTEVLKTEIVPKVAINYAWSDGPGFQIDSKNFGGFWIGKVNIETPGIYTVTATQGRSDVRVIIDGHEIPSGTETKIELAAGEYQVEVEYLNNWHTVDFLMALEPTKTKYDLQELKEVVSAAENTYDVWYVYGYNEGPTLNITKTAQRPTIIFLESYEPTQWQINNAKANNIAYIVYASFEPGANVKSDLASERILLVDREVIPDPNSAGSAGVEARCWTDNYPPRCDNVYTVSNLDRFANEFSGGSLTGFTALTGSDENRASVTIPQVALNASKIAEILAENEKIKAEAEVQAKKEAGSSVETLFSN